MKKTNLLIASFLILIFLNSCGTIVEGLGGTKKKGSDEFLVEKKSPLVLPPSFGELPEPGKEPEQNIISYKKDTSDIEDIINQGSFAKEPWLIMSSISEVSFLYDIIFCSGSFPGSGNSPKLGGSTKGDFFSTKNSSLPFFLVPPNPSTIVPQEFKKISIKKEAINRLVFFIYIFIIKEKFY